MNKRTRNVALRNRVTQLTQNQAVQEETELPDPDAKKMAAPGAALIFTRRKQSQTATLSGINRTTTARLVKKNRSNSLYRYRLPLFLSETEFNVLKNSGEAYHD